MPRQGGLDNADGTGARHHAAGLRYRDEVAKMSQFNVPHTASARSFPCYKGIATLPK